MSDYVDCALCIICQKVKKKEKLSSTENGTERIKHASKIRRDIVYDRLNVLSPNDTVHYHTNTCYKDYTHKNSLKKLEADVTNDCKNDNVEDVNGNTESEPTSAINRKSKRLSEEHKLNTTGCILCGKPKKLTEMKNEETAKKLFNASRHFQDETFTKTSLLNDAEAFLASKLKYHKNCLRSYLQQYERSTMPINQEQPENDIEPMDIEPVDIEAMDINNSSIEVTKAIIDIIKSVESRLKVGEKFALSDISTLIANKYGSEMSVKNSKIKSCLIDYFGDKVCFVYSKDKRKSQSFYCTDVEVNGHDSISTCADVLKKSLKEVEFDLQDKFCDDNDLKFSFRNMKIPEPFLLFLSKLFDIDEKDILKEPSNYDEDTSNAKKIKILRIKSLFQILYFIKYNGLQKTPQHILTGLYLYNSTKSKNTIMILNRLGCSISYDEVLRIRTRLGLYAIECCKSYVPLPNHFDCNSYVTAAFDNFDHNEATISGMNSTHDTVAVIFQDMKESNDTKKPNISETSVNKRSRTFTTILKCQELKEFHKLAATVNLPLNYEINTDNRSLSSESFENELHVTDFAWLLSRLQISTTENEISVHTSIQNTPSWSSFNSAVHEDNRCKQKVGYLPIIPSPVTEYATVYTSLCNFKDILSQLKQTHLPVTCDEGVYRIARHIMLQNEREFANIILCLGNFHLIKVTTACIGKYLKNSGVENVFIETGLFGIGTTEQLLSGSNYARSVKGFNYLAEALRRLQIKAFFTKERLEKYADQLITVTLLQESLQTEEFDECKHILKEFVHNCSGLLKDFQDFVVKRCQQSELFRYWNNVLTLISFMFNLIRADRTGDWDLHIRTVEKLQAVFHVMDRVNYARWCSVYLEDMLRLEKKSPEVYTEFMNGRFTVKRSDVPFTSVATDQALEQTINRTSKSKSGVIGITKKKEAVAIWDISYHELLAVSNYFKELTYFNNEDEELHIHHEFSKSTTKNSEIAVDNILTYLENKCVNPFMTENQPLRNIVTEELVHPDISQELLNLFEKGIAKYNCYRNERFVEKTKPLSATISRNNLPNFKTQPQSEKFQSKKKTNKLTISETQRIISLANERNYPLEKLLTYELTSENQLFDEDGFFTKEKNKSLLVRELEKTELDEITKTMNDKDTITCLIIDVMLVLRKISWKGKKDFKDLADSLCKFVLQKAAASATKRIDLVFDSYFEKSIKSSERIRRGESESIIYNYISGTTTLPKQEDKFWGSSKNKILLQTFLKEYLMNEENLSKFQLIFSTMNDVLCTSNNLYTTDNLQCTHIEEADVKIIVHANDATKNGYKNIYIISSDTDVIILALHFFKTFQENGLQTLWIRAGTGISTRNIPVHSLAHHHGDNLCSALPALHHLTGSDYTSKVGSKTKALQAKPQQYLAEFGQGNCESTVEQNIQRAEEYLVNVINKNSKCKSFDKLRYWFYHAKSSLVSELPPTSNSIRLHILRAYYIVHMQTSCLDLNVQQLDPNQYGFIEQDDVLMPERVQVLLPPADELIPNCTCKMCVRKSCVCVAAEISCCSFCVCKRDNTCKNKF